MSAEHLICTCGSSAAGIHAHEVECGLMWFPFITDAAGYALANAAVRLLVKYHGPADHDPSAYGVWGVWGGNKTGIPHDKGDWLGMDLTVEQAADALGAIREVLAVLKGD